MLILLGDPKSCSSVFTLYFFPHRAGQRMGKICLVGGDGDGVAISAVCEGRGTESLSVAITPSDSSSCDGWVEVDDSVASVAAARAEGWGTGITEAYSC